jgi:MraZ protein
VSELEEAGAALKPLIGTDEATIDDKGRLLVSKKKRDRLGENFAMYLGDTGCIFAYPGLTWDQMCQEMKNYDPSNQGTVVYTREVMGTAEDELEFDPQGRVVVPRKLRDAARLKDKVLLIGCNSRLEIWAADEFARYEQDPAGYAQARRERMRDAYTEMKAS